MSEKKLKTVRRTIVVLVPTDVPVTERALQWEASGKTNNRQVYRVERASANVGKVDAYVLDMQLSCKGANRHDFTKFVKSYLPEAKSAYITD